MLRAAQPHTTTQQFNEAAKWVRHHCARTLPKLVCIPTAIIVHDAVMPWLSVRHRVVCTNDKSWLQCSLAQLELLERREQPAWHEGFQRRAAVDSQ